MMLDVYDVLLEEMEEELHDIVRAFTKCIK